MMKQKRSLLSMVVLVLVTVVFAFSSIFTTACTPQDVLPEYAVTWNVPEGVTVAVEGYEALPELVEEGTELSFTVTVPNGYEVSTVKANGSTKSAKDGKYAVEIKKDTNFVITVEKQVSSISVTAPTKLNYFAGDKLDVTGMVVSVTYATNETEAITSGYTITPEVFAEGDTEFTVSYKGKSQTIALEGPVQSRSFTMTSAELRIVDGKPCYVLSGGYANYEEEIFKTIKFDFQENGFFGDPYDSSTVYGGWGYVDVAADKMSLEFGNGAFTLIIDMSDFADKRIAVDAEGNYMGTCYLPHIGFSETAGDNLRTDIKVPSDGTVVIEEGQTITVGDITYTLLSGDAEKGWNWWNICAVIIKDNSPVEAPEGETSSEEVAE